MLEQPVNAHKQAYRHIHNLRFAMMAQIRFVHLAKLYAVLVTLIFVGTVLYAGYSNYIAVPIWDMWNQYLEFYYRTRTEGWAPWWEQHNEHRLLIAKLLFWIDIHFLKGNAVFLLVLNIIFSVLMFVTLSLTLLKLQGRTRDALFYLGVALLAALCFSWLQWENYLWAFQSQFHMSYLFPLWTFLALAKARELGSSGWFAAAVVLGFSSMLTMANGVMVLPLLLGMAWVLGFKVRQITVLLICAVVAPGLYFHDYTWPESKLSFVEGAWAGLKLPLMYFLNYLSGPFYGLGGGMSAYFFLPALAFLVLCAGVTFAVYRKWVASKQQTATAIGLLFFILLIGGGAVSAAIGRFYIGEHIPSRYMTPSLLGWSSVLLLLVYLGAKHKWVRGCLMVSSVLIVFLLLPRQKQAIEFSDVAHKIRVAAAAVAMHINDYDALRLLFWDFAWMHDIAERARPEGRSIFSQDYIRHIPELHTRVSKQTAPECLLKLDQSSVIFDQPDYARVSGWVYAPEAERVPSMIVFVTGGLASGYALSGQQRLDVKQHLNRKQAQFSGFDGYVLTHSLQQSELIMYGLDRHNTVICTALIE